MKRIITLTALSIIALSACKKETITSSQINSESQTNASGSGSDGDGSGSGGNGGGTNTTGLLQNVLSGTASRLIAGTTDSIWVSFTQPAPAGGWTLNLTSSNPAAAQWLLPISFLQGKGVLNRMLPADK